MTITIVGGTYREYCVEPAIDRLLGSGLRAAGLLASLGDDVAYVTAIEESSAPEFDAVCASLAVSANAAPRTGSVAFAYETPIHRTTAHGRPVAEPLHVQGGTVLAFGMVETTWALTADTVVIDPQHSTVKDLLKVVEAQRITLILNEHEARAAAERSDVEHAALELLGLGVDAVVVKRGALGGLVAHSDTIATFGAIPTSAVHPLGSGDAFSAGYIHAWTGGATPLAAAQFGSQVAAAHSLTGTPQISQSVLDSLGQPLPYPRRVAPRIYLAGPFFNAAQRHLIRTIRAALIHLGAEVFSPLDEVGPGGDEVAEKDLRGLQSCHSVLAVLDGADPGTLFEVGWATHAQIPVTGFAEHPTEHTWTMARGTGTTVGDDLSSALYNSVWSAIAASAIS
ncbi:PfkB family carbohydrate kinase [Mycobacteroides sp. LB1]|uniref:PfkB family carbohydrate kinase n=1 Tax=Mycobacteroides sp. LB1 TaxID=2750814 RepID=UPI0015DFCA07|nr:nucleoside 2-deoxyribosyltransferase [Mycobacteroides sp. LB1]